jgi:hypothetical protein
LCLKCISLFSDRLKIEGSNVINVDVPASNGVIQVVENVIELDKEENYASHAHETSSRQNAIDFTAK